MKDRSLFAEVLGTVTKYFLILVLLVLFGIFLSSIRKVDTGNVAVVLRFGRLVGKTEAEQVHEPGLLFAFPYIIDEVVTVPVGSVIEQSVITHYTEDGTDTVNGGYVITGDQNIAVIAASVKYSISDPDLCPARQRCGGGHQCLCKQCDAKRGGRYGCGFHSDRRQGCL